MWRLLFLTLFLSTISSVFGADSLKTRKKFFFAGFAAAAYKGSLASSYSRWTPALTFGLRFEKKKRVNGMVVVTIGRVIGEDRSYVAPSNTPEGISPVNRFQTNYFSLHYEAQFLLAKVYGFQFYASPGIGFIRFSPKDWEGRSLIDRSRTRRSDESYSQNALVLPLQVGFRYVFENQISLGMEMGWMNTRTRYLDNMDKLSDVDGNDNIANIRFQFFVPIR